LSNWKVSFYRTSSGSEIDLILEKGNKRMAIECKGSTSPNLNRSFWNAVSDIDFQEVWIIAPVKEAYPIEKGVMVAPPHQLIERLMAKEK
jgi:predicted AAA+ superfamily ATPase